MTALDPKFAAGVRGHLIETAGGSSPLATRTRLRRVGLGVGAGAGVALLLTAGALAVAAGVPGEHVISPLGTIISASHSGTATIDLGSRPEAANAARITLVCTSDGTFAIADALLTCGTGGADVGGSLTIADLALDGTSFTVTADAGASWDIVAQYVATVTTEWAVNSNGQTYGTANENGVPDLTAAQATNGEQGYVYFTDLWRTDGASADSVRVYESDGTSAYVIPVYKSDGITVIGEFPIG